MFHSGLLFPPLNPADNRLPPLFFQMENSLRQRVVGQDHVLSSISDAVRISRAGLQAPNRPVASFLFLGPTGVGKVSSFRHSNIVKGC